MMTTHRVFQIPQCRFSRFAFLLWFFACFGQAQNLQEAVVKATPEGYVGSTVCKTCHADVAVNFYRNAHFKSIVLGKETPAHTGCEGCHGPGKAHVAAGGGKQSIPRAFSLMKPAQVVDTCLECHGRDLARANIRRSEHTLNQVACSSCHSIHRAATPKFLLAKKQVDLCYGCHDDVRAQFSMPFRHRVNEGFMQCTDCHNPHGTFAPPALMSQRPRMVAAALLNDQPCLKCHVDKRGPFVYEHAPVRAGGCIQCHMPHGTANAKLLVRPVVFTLCLECHTGAGDFGKSGRGVVLQEAGIHNMLDPKFQKCVLCHVRVHGSNSDPTFFK
jgi:DmsE family decaheme c-type cytochrome